MKKGVKKISDFISEHVSPEVSEIWDKVKRCLAKLKGENEEIVQEESTAVQA